jgi:hypothetical protein
MNKILVIEAVGLKPHLETAGEIALTKSKSKNSRVIFSWVGDNLNDHDMSLPLIARIFGASLPKRVSMFTDILNKNKIKIINPAPISTSTLNNIKLWALKFNGSLNELRKYRYKNAYLGLGVASSLISFFGDSKIDPIRKIKVTRNFLISSAIVFERSKTIIRIIKPNGIYTFNGRFSVTKAITEAARLSNIKIFRHERASHFSKYEIFEKPIQDFNYIETRINLLWNRTKTQKKFLAGKKFFIKKRNGEGIGWHSFTRNQKKNLLPEFKKNKLILTYFSSSEDEFEAFRDQYISGPWKDQISAMKDLVRIVDKYNNLHLIIRMHPNLVNKSGKQNKEWFGLEGDSVSIIKPQQHIDSYALLDASSLILTFGSTIGIEAVFWKKISILLGPSAYQNSRAILKPKNKEELEFYIKNYSNYKTSDNLDALKYGFYQMQFGIPYTFYKPYSLFDGYFMGVKLDSNTKCIKLLKAIQLDHLFFSFLRAVKYYFPIK